MKQTIDNVPAINPTEIIKKVSTLNQFGRGEQWNGTITAEQLAALNEAVKCVGGEVQEPRKSTLEHGDAIRRLCANLELSGVSKLTDLYVTECYWNDNKQRVKCLVEYVVPHLVINNRAYSISCYGYEKPGTTFELFLPHFDPDRVEVSYNGGWKFNEPAPSKVGKATVKKLNAWVDWLDRQNASRAAWKKEGKDVCEALFARLEAAGAEYRQFGNTVTIRNGILKMDVQIGEHDIYSGRIEVDLSAFSGDKLSLLIDSEITITPKHR